MSYLALARKYRPQSFEEMVGQEHALQSLVNALDNGNMHHAYLFTGTRGVGKTTIARILTKCLNNPSGVTSKPDLESEVAQEITKGTYIDLLEVDAASRTKVDQTRELLENIHYPPGKGRFKVYLIDEVHMLSTSSFNALLKPLEEPPEFVKFLLATTDPQKIPITVLSRCLQINLKLIPENLIEQQLQTILSAEKIEYQQGALRLIAKAARGSMRDALSITDQAISFTNRNLAEAEIQRFLGVVDQRRVETLLVAIINGNASQILKSIEDVSQFTPDYQALLDDILEYLQAAAIKKQIADYTLTVDKQQCVEEMAQKLSAETIQLYYQIAMRSKKELEIVTNQRSGLEMILLRMIAFTPVKSLQQIQIPNEPKKQETIAETTIETTEAVVAQREITNDDWIAAFEKIDLFGFARELIGNAHLVEHRDKKMVFALGRKHKEVLENQYLAKVIAQLEKLFAIDGLTVELREQQEVPQRSPLMLQKQQKEAGEQEVINEHDAKITDFMQQFDGKIIDNTQGQ